MADKSDTPRTEGIMACVDDGLFKNNDYEHRKALQEAIRIGVEDMERELIAAHSAAVPGLAIVAPIRYGNGPGEILPPAPHPEESQDWRTAVIDALVVAGIYTKEHDSNPRKALHELICWENSVALDPRVSKEARALQEESQDARRLRELSEILVNGGSIDWVSAKGCRCGMCREYCIESDDKEYRADTLLEAIDAAIAAKEAP
jgi:hypothetical protein